MDILRDHPCLSIASVLLVFSVAYLWRLNNALTTTPPEMLALTPRRWTTEEISQTYQRVKANPVDWSKHLPPKLNRRYIITGGSGGVGGEIILHLLARGESPSAIRNVDLRFPDREDLLSGAAAEVDFAQADLSSASSTNAAFDKPWPVEVTNLPLTVFHTAAVISFHERRAATYERVERANIAGCTNVLSASKAAGADVFVSTSSSFVAVKPVRYFDLDFFPLFRRSWPRNYTQPIDEADFYAPLRPREDFWGNYAYSKAVSERMVCRSNSVGFRTGVIRPANGVYGSSKADQLVGMCLRLGTFPTWMTNVVQNFVHAGHVSLGHLLFEAALVNNTEKLPPCAGKPFNITDPCPPTLFLDFYKLVEQTAETYVKVVYLQPVPMLLISYVVEIADTISGLIPGLGWLKPTGQLALLQPPVFSSSTHVPASDAAAQKSVEDGGLGYKGVCTTLEGICQQVAEWNRDHQGSGAAQNGKTEGLETCVKVVKSVGTIPAVVKA
ncbi:uncharacterized protein BCR38DRAFT_339266 [Pseudomassariella vexata]|uniref:NAD-dependent epimerase/dehydratase domain-containing protein n=1 Tax=Pseudomassariella vexata TaxID=1141098 RepID=A0A1Y2E429_9PEZI|nr:uncharacterized protein BCR38DRAFT_339266 [Pseudomassariella vexata]ORY66046.1 hypothetical protein BCR38DRAFT_339266 [Pseudomassariella vexata]